MVETNGVEKWTKSANPARTAVGVHDVGFARPGFVISVVGHAILGGGFAILTISSDANPKRLVLKTTENKAMLTRPKVPSI